MTPLDQVAQAADAYAQACGGTTGTDAARPARIALLHAVIAASHAHAQALHKLTLLPVRDDMAASLEREIVGMKAGA